jgi:hypothetical protein
VQDLSSKSLHEWLHKTASGLSKKSELAKAIRYALSNWVALTRYCEDGRLEIDNNAAERALRAVALGRKNWLFAGSDDGGERAAAIYTLLGTAKLNDLNPKATCVTSSSASPIIPSIKSKTSCPGALRSSSRSFSGPPNAKACGMHRGAPRFLSNSCPLPTSLRDPRMLSGTGSYGIRHAACPW